MTAPRPRAAGEDPCAFTATGFPRRTSPCGANGNCTVLDTKSALTPHQWEFNCTCLGNYEGERCERCSPGYTIASGCADVARKSADGLIVQSAGYVKTFAAVGMSLMVISLASLAVNLVGSVRKDKGIVRARAPSALDPVALAPAAAPRYCAQAMAYKRGVRSSTLKPIRSGRSRSSRCRGCPSPRPCRDDHVTCRARGDGRPGRITVADT